MRSFNHQRRLFDSTVSQSLISIQLWHLRCSLCGVCLLSICQMRNNSCVVLKCPIVLFKQCECFLLMSASPISGLARSLLISSFAYYPGVTRPVNPQPPAKRNFSPIVPFHCPRFLAAREWLNATITMKLSKASSPTTTHNVGNGAHNTLL
jgi:hypothetical protein